MHVYRTYAFINQCSKGFKMFKLPSHLIIKSSKGEYFTLLTLNVKRYGLRLGYWNCSGNTAQLLLYTTRM